MDIIILAAISFFIFVKLRSQLGKIDESERSNIQDKINKKKQLLESIQQQMMANPDKIKVAKSVHNKADDKAISHLDDNSKNQFIAAMNACNISSEFFLNGAKSAFEMVIKAFSQEDLETLKTLLSDNIYKGFEQSINQRKTSEHKLISNMIAIEEATIKSASMIQNNASIVIEFASQQINYVTDKDGQVIEGKKEDILELTDTWTFQKDITSNNPNWLIVSTNC